MPNLLTRGQAFFDRTLPKVAGVALTVQRLDDLHGESRGSLTADAVGRAFFRRDDAGMTRIEVGERDYHIAVGAYVLDGRVVEPRTGDRFVEVIRGFTVTFDIRPIPGEPAWRFLDPSRTRYRIHVMRVTDDAGD